MICWGGDLGNSIFMLLTGYFMVKRQVNWQKIFLLVSTMTLYSWVSMIIAYSGNFATFSLKGFLKGAFPLLFGEYWFLSCYVIFSVFIPFVNTFLNNLTKKQYFLYLILFFLMLSILPAFKINTYFNAGILFFGLSYSIGGYIKLYGDTFLNEKWHRKCGLYFLIMLILLWASILFMDGFGILYHHDIFIRNAYRWQAIFSIPMSVTLFIYFLTRPCFYRGYINTIAGTVLGIYLIHDNDFMRPIIWGYIFPNSDWIYSGWFPLFLVVKVLGVFAVCSFIELLRKRLLDKTFNKAWDWLLANVYPKVDKLRYFI